MEKGRIPGIVKIWFASFRSFDVRVKEYTRTPTAGIDTSRLRELPIVSPAELECESGCELNQTVHSFLIEFILTDNAENRLIRDELLKGNKSIVCRNFEGETFLFGGSEAPFPSFVCKSVNKQRERYLLFEMTYTSEREAVLCI